MSIKGTGISDICSLRYNDLDQQDEQKILLTIKDEFRGNEKDIEVKDDGIDLPVFPGCPISLNVSMFLNLLFMTRHKLTNVPLDDLFLLLTTHMSDDYKPKMSLYLSKKYFQKVPKPAKHI